MWNSLNQHRLSFFGIIKDQKWLHVNSIRVKDSVSPKNSLGGKQNTKHDK